MSYTNDLSSISSISFDPTKLLNKEDNESKDDTFKQMFNSILNIYNNTNDSQTNLSNIQMDFATGKSDDVLALMLAQEKAYTSLNFAVQVTNKIVSAYREIMSIQL